VAALLPADVERLIAELDRSMADQRFSDEEKRSFAQMLRELDPPEEAFRQVRNRAFELAHGKLDGSNGPALLRWLEGVIRALDVARAPAHAIRSYACFSPGEGCRNTITQHLREARRNADLCVFTLSDDRITREVLAAHRRGVAFRFITDNTKEFDAGSDIAMLRSAGVPIAVDRTDAHMHHKFAIFDGTWLLNGSYNWTRSACEHNEENLVASNDPALVGQFQRAFEQLWTSLRT
jgi:cardiolipin hydrolase